MPSPDSTPFVSAELDVLFSLHSRLHDEIIRLRREGAAITHTDAAGQELRLLSALTAAVSLAADLGVALRYHQEG